MMIFLDSLLLLFQLDIAPTSGHDRWAIGLDVASHAAALKLRNVALIARQTQIILWFLVWGRYDVPLPLTPMVLFNQAIVAR